MNKTEKIRKIYTLLLSAFIAAMAIALICVAADIYYSGAGYSRELVGNRLKNLAIPLLFLIAAMFAGAIFPLAETKAKRPQEEALRKLQRKMPAGGEGEEFEAARKAYKKMNVIKWSVWGAALAVALGGAIASLVYLCNAANFKNGSFNACIINMVKVVLPCTFAALLCLTAASFVNGYCAKEQVKHIKTMLRCGGSGVEIPKELQFLDKINKVASHNITLWVVRGAVAALAIIFIILGVLNGGAYNVLMKAVQLCQECIGIG